MLVYVCISILHMIKYAELTMSLIYDVDMIKK
jgi:hypothetical protein